MSFRRKKLKEPFSMDMTTCSDIIFTLLLFYILTQNFLPQTTLDLPETISSEQTESVVQIKVEVSDSGNITWNDVAYQEEELVEKVIESSYEQDKYSIMIFCHRKAPAGICIELLDKLKNAGIKNVIFDGQPVKKK